MHHWVVSALKNHLPHAKVPGTFPRKSSQVISSYSPNGDVQHVAKGEPVVETQVYPENQLFIPIGMDL